MPFVHGYIRVSTTDQADHGVSLDGQRERIRQEWERVYQAQGFEYGRVYEDRATSGGTQLRSRKAGNQLSMDLLPGDVVVFTKLDRGFRNTEDLLATVRVWEERQVRVVFLDLQLDTANPISRLIMGVMGLVAEFERVRIRDRIREGVAECRRQGRRSGGRVPYGCKVVGAKPNRRLVVDEEQFKIGQHIVKWKQTEGFTWQAIAAHLNTKLVPRRTSGHDPQTLERCKHWNWMAVWRAYKGTLKTMLWIEEKKVKPPKGVVA